MPERRILLTGFEPWADHAWNPAQRLAERLDGWRQGDARVVGLVLPVARDGANATVAAAVRDLRPRAIVHLGLAAGRPALTVERWAHNVADFVVPDNAGAQPRGEPLTEDGRARLASRLSVAAAVDALRQAGVSAEASDTAGTFVCNAVLYGTLRWAAAHRYQGPVGFVHLPSADTLSLQDQERAVERLLALLATSAAACSLYSGSSEEGGDGDGSSGEQGDRGAGRRGGAGGVGDGLAAREARSALPAGGQGR